MRYFIFLLVLSQSLAAFAARSPYPSITRADRISIIASMLSVDGKVLPDIQQFVAETLQMEQRAGREFSRGEIISVATEEIRVRGRPFACFTGDMRVLTPAGYVAIKNLKVGDEVVSWNVNANARILNRIAKTYVTNNVAYGQLCDLKPEGQSIQATGSHPFYSADAQDYQALAAMSDATRLLQVRGCETNLTPRGAFQFPTGRGTVFTFTLDKAPNNFFIEGILVHNKGHVT